MDHDHKPLLEIRRKHTLGRRRRGMLRRLPPPKSGSGSQFCNASGLTPNSCARTKRLMHRHPRGGPILAAVMERMERSGVSEKERDIMAVKSPNQEHSHVPTSGPTMH